MVLVKTLKSVSVRPKLTDFFLNSVESPAVLVLAKDAFLLLCGWIDCGLHRLAALNEVEILSSLQSF